MLPFQGNFAYSVKRNEEIVAEDCWENCGADAAYSGCLFRSGGTYVFCFMTEEELAAIPLPLGDGSLFQGGRNDHLLGFGSMPGQNMDDPKAGEYYTARAVFYPALSEVITYIITLICSRVMYIHLRIPIFIRNSEVLFE